MCRVCSLETKSKCGRTNPASMRAMFSAREPIGRIPRVRPASISPSQTALRIPRVHPQLIAQVAGKPGARYHGQRHTGKIERADFEGFQPLDAGNARRV